MTTDFYKEEALNRKKRIENQRNMDEINGAIYKENEMKKYTNALNINDSSNPVAMALIKASNKTNEDYTENTNKVKKFLESYASREDIQTIVDDYLDDEEMAFIVKTIPAIKKELTQYADLTPEDFGYIVRRMMSEQTTAVKNVGGISERGNQVKNFKSENGKYDDIGTIVKNKRLFDVINLKELEFIAKKFVEDGGIDDPAVVYDEKQDGTLSKVLHKPKDLRKMMWYYATGEDYDAALNASGSSASSRGSSARRSVSSTGSATSRNRRHLDLQTLDRSSESEGGVDSDLSLRRGSNSSIQSNGSGRSIRSGEPSYLDIYPLSSLVTPQRSSQPPLSSSEPSRRRIPSVRLASPPDRVVTRSMTARGRVTGEGLKLIKGRSVAFKDSTNIISNLSKNARYI